MAAAVALAAVGLLPVPTPPSTAAGGTAAPVVVSVDPAQPLASFRTDEALGGAVDGHEQGDAVRRYTPENLAAMESAGLRPLTYRLRTELGDEAWHWNPDGTWSDPVHRQGYWTSSATPSAPIEASYGYRLPRRGNTVDQANNDGYSRIDDGDPATFWKSDPYLDEHFTGEPDDRHLQWVVVDLGRTAGVDAARLSWGVPYGVRFRFEYWTGRQNPFCPWQLGVDPCLPDHRIDVTDHWRPFPRGAVSAGRGGDAVVRLGSTPLAVRFVRLLLLQGSGTAPAGSTDVRDRLGFALRELGVGTEDGHGVFHDLVRHGRSRRDQSMVSVSSTDPWHGAGDRDPDTEQPGFDRVLRSGLTHGLPAVVPVPVLFGTPDDARAEIRYLAAIGFPVGRVEIGEEPDGQNVLPEDYGALFVQWARAIHAVDPGLALGGPALQTGFAEVAVWADRSGDASWLHRLSRYLAARGASREFAFLSVEWYPFDEPCPPFGPQLAAEPGLLSAAFRRFTDEAFGHVPVLVTEYGYSAFETEAEVDLPGALLDADFVAQFLSLGGTAAYLYGYEPSTPARNENCDSWGDNMMLEADDAGRVVDRLPTYWETRLLVGTWAEPGHRPNRLYQTTVRTADGSPAPVTAYGLLRPDGRWALLVLNKDPGSARRVDVRFTVAGRSVGFSGPVELHRYGPDRYHWKAAGAGGRPDRSLPPAVYRLAPGRPFTAPAWSLAVLVGGGPPGSAGAGAVGGRR